MKPNYTITHFLYMMMGTCLMKRPKNVPASLRHLVEFAADIVRIWEANRDEIEEELGHDNFFLTEVDVFDDLHTERRWEEREKSGPYTGRLYIRFLPRLAG